MARHPDSIHAIDLGVNTLRRRNPKALTKTVDLANVRVLGQLGFKGILILQS
jgi:hypothetical protein